MATVVELDGSGALFKLDPNLGPSVQELRCIYGSPRLKDWIESTLPALEGNWGVELTPLEQLQGFVEEVFCPGEPLTFDWQFKPLTYIRDGIWELKTADWQTFRLVLEARLLHLVCLRSEEQNSQAQTLSRLRRRSSALPLCS